MNRLSRDNVPAFSYFFGDDDALSCLVMIEESEQVVHDNYLITDRLLQMIIIIMLIRHVTISPS